MKCVEILFYFTINIRYTITHVPANETYIKSSLIAFAKIPKIILKHVHMLHINQTIYYIIINLKTFSLVILNSIDIIKF